MFTSVRDGVPGRSSASSLNTRKAARRRDALRDQTAGRTTPQKIAICTGAKITKRHDTATTPHQRAAACNNIPKQAVTAMNATFAQLQPATLSRQILALTAELETLAQAKKAPRTRPVNHTWNHQTWRSKPNEATS